MPSTPPLFCFPLLRLLLSSSVCCVLPLPPPPPLLLAVRLCIAVGCLWLPAGKIHPALPSLGSGLPHSQRPTNRTNPPQTQAHKSVTSTYLTYSLGFSDLLLLRLPLRCQQPASQQTHRRDRSPVFCDPRNRLVFGLPSMHLRRLPLARCHCRRRRRGSRQEVSANPADIALAAVPAHMHQAQRKRK